MTTLDLRPALLRVKVYPEQRHTLLFRFPEGTLIGDWEARIDGAAVESTDVDGDDLSVQFITPVETGSYDFEVWSFNADPDSLKILGSIQVSRSATSTVSSTEIDIRLDDTIIDLEIIGVGPQGPPGEPGEPGEQGPPGIPGDAAARIPVFHQSLPETLWVIDHNLGYDPLVTVIDSAGSVVLTTIRYPLPGQRVEVHNLYPFSGKAILA